MMTRWVLAVWLAGWGLAVLFGLAGWLQTARAQAGRCTASAEPAAPPVTGWRRWGGVGGAALAVAGAQVVGAIGRECAVTGAAAAGAAALLWAAGVGCALAVLGAVILHRLGRPRRRDVLGVVGAGCLLLALAAGLVAHECSAANDGRSVAERRADEQRRGQEVATTGAGRGRRAGQVVAAGVIAVGRTLDAALAGELLVAESAGRLAVERGLDEVGGRWSWAGVLAVLAATAAVVAAGLSAFDGWGRRRRLVLVLGRGLALAMGLALLPWAFGLLAAVAGHAAAPVVRFELWLAGLGAGVAASLWLALRRPWPAPAA